MSDSRIPFELDNVQCLYEIARLKYQQGKSEREIAVRFGFEQDNRTQIRKALARAEELGIVIKPPVAVIRPGGLPIDYRRLEARLCVQFGLKHAEVIEGISEAYDGSDRNMQNIVLDRIARAAAVYFNALMEGPPRPQVVCINWGYTMRLFVNHVTDLEPTQRQQRRSSNRRPTYFLPMVGIMGTGNRIQVAEREAYQLALELARKYDAIPLHLPCPAIIRNEEHARVVESLEPVKRSLEQLRKSQIAVTSVGFVDDKVEDYSDMTIVKQHLLTIDEVKAMRQRGACGEIANWFFDESGREKDGRDPQVRRLRPIGLGLDGLRRIANSDDGQVIAICGSDHRRLPALKACLRSQPKMISALFTDHITALQLLEQ